MAARTGSLDPKQSLRSIRALRFHLETLTDLQVAHARSFEWSWGAIAKELGVSRQALHQKYASPTRRRSRAGRAFARRYKSMPGYNPPLDIEPPVPGSTEDDEPYDAVAVLLWGG